MLSGRAATIALMTERLATLPHRSEGPRVDDVVAVDAGDDLLLARVLATPARGRFLVAPLERLDLGYTVPADAIVRRWRRAPRLPSPPAAQLTLTDAGPPSGRRPPLDVSQLRPGDLVLVADLGAWHGHVRGTVGRRIAVVPTTSAHVVRKVAPGAIADHWQRVPAPTPVPAAQLPIDLPQTR